MGSQVIFDFDKPDEQMLIQRWPNGKVAQLHVNPRLKKTAVRKPKVVRVSGG